MLPNLMDKLILVVFKVCTDKTSIIGRFSRRNPGEI